MTEKRSALKKINVLLLILTAVIVVVFSVLYFTSGSLIFLKLGLLAIGVLNILNGIIAVKSGMSAVAVIYLIGGAALTLIMTYSLFIQ